jgi:hypothetical protein
LDCDIDGPQAPGKQESSKKRVFCLGKPVFPFGKPTFPNGKAKFPFGEPEKPLGKCQKPLGKRDFPNGKPKFPKGKTASPYGKSNFPFGKTKFPVLIISSGMRLILLSLVATLGLSAIAAPPTATLPRAHFDIAEIVFRDCIAHSDQESVYHLSSGTNDAVLPADFMERFKGQSPLARSTSDGTSIVNNRWLTDKLTKKPAARLSIREIRVGRGSAEAQLHYVSSSTTLSARYYLVREHGKWRVRDQKTEFIACRR